jgi:hypothetical protein
MTYDPFAGIIAALQAIGLSPELKLESGTGATRVDRLLEVKFDGIRQRFAVEHKSRAPYQGELDALDQRRRKLSKLGAPLLVAPEISPTLGSTLVAAGWSWADGHGNYYLQAPGLRLVRTGQRRVLEPKTGSLPGGLGGRRILRWLISEYDERSLFTITALAEIAGITQAAGSQFVAQLRELGFVTARRGLGGVDREALLHEFLRQYPGAGGHVDHAYSLAPPNVVADALSRGLADDVAISADVGPDLLAPWRAPSTLIVYARRPIRLDAFGLTAAQGRGDANVLIHYPADETVFVNHEQRERLPSGLADPVQMYVDLHRLGGDDRIEAAGKLESWILK